MKTITRDRIKFTLIASALLVLALFAVTGCGATPEQRQAELQKWLDINNQVKSGLVAATQPIPQMEAEVKALPAGKVKDEAGKLLEQEKNYLATGVKVTEGAGKVLVAAQSGDAVATGAAITSTLSGLPVVGAYAGLAGTLIMAGIGVYQSIQKNRAIAVANDANQQAQDALDQAKATQEHLENVVHSIDVAIPTRTPEQKSSMAAAQGAATTAAVSAIKTDLAGGT